MRYTLSSLFTDYSQTAARQAEGASMHRGTRCLCLQD
jgi:hypothetical protein